MHAAVIDVGSEPKIGWVVDEQSGTNLDECIDALAEISMKGPLALGFESPLFVPIRNNRHNLTKGRKGDDNRAFTASAGATALVTGLVVAAYMLENLRAKAPHLVPTFNWRSPLADNNLLLFEAFVANQKKTHENRHIEDAQLAMKVFLKGMSDAPNLKSSIEEPVCLNLLGALLVRLGWVSDLPVLKEQCLVVKTG